MLSSKQFFFRDTWIPSVHKQFLSLNLLLFSMECHDDRQKNSNHCSTSHRCGNRGNTTTSWLFCRQLIVGSWSCGTERNCAISSHEVAALWYFFSKYEQRHVGFADIVPERWNVFVDFILAFVPARRYCRMFKSSWAALCLFFQDFLCVLSKAPHLFQKKKFCSVVFGLAVEFWYL